MHSALAALAAASLIVSGCALMGVEEQQERMRATVVVRGTVATDFETDNPLVVVLIRDPDEPGQIRVIFDHFVLDRPGRFRFTVSAGSYGVSAFEDRNRNLKYDPDEAIWLARDHPSVRVEAGDRSDPVAIVIPEEGRAEVEGSVDVAELQARSVHDQLNVSLWALSVKGEIADLDDDKFGPETGTRGLWKPFDFVFDVGAGIYFLEPYDPDRIPVLFVHGISGYPREFAHLAESLDRTRYQAWFYFYPSGAKLPNVVNHLSGIYNQLQLTHGFRRAAVVAHSMGGLVARGFVQQHHRKTDKETIRTLVSVSTPWGGHAASKMAVKHAPVVVHSWRNVAPKSDFLTNLFFEGPDDAKTADRPRRGLPEHVDFHLLFGFKRREMRPGLSGDGVVTLKSELRLEAQHDAKSILGLNYGHTGILRSPEATERINGILDETFGRSDGWLAGVGLTD